MYMVTGLLVLFMIAITLTVFFGNTKKPKKRNHLFENKEGDRDNPFHTDSGEQESPRWRY